MTELGESVLQESHLDDSDHLPRCVNLSDFIKNRMEEVVMLTETIKESPFRGQAFQRLPKHMRRRQMSHYAKRLPRRLLRPYLMSLKDGPPPPVKRPSRKFRRRPSNLLIEYNRRQKDFVWLETHIWHAKRFHMIKKWGYKLPEKPTNKCFRACYRAISEHCFLSDISYYNCIELEGPEKILLDGLKQCTSPQCGLTFGAKMYLDGAREGHVTVFHPNSYPNKVIGNVSFMWQPSIRETEDRKIWIWVHPLMYSEMIECFKTLFNLVPQTESTGCSEESMTEENEADTKEKIKKRRKKKKMEKKSKKKIEQIKLEPKNIPFIRTPKFKNGDETVIMSSLKDTLNRFQLTGPLSQAIISQVFSVPFVDKEKSELDIAEVQCKKRKLDETNIIEEVDEESATNGDKMEEWWVDYYKDDIQKRNWQSQKNFYEKLASYCWSHDMPFGMILSVVVEDPRLKIPPKKEKAVPKVQDFYQMTSVETDPSLSQSPIWNPEVRDRVSMTKLTTHEINEFRSKKIVPGFDVNDIIPDEKQSRIPILLVQRPGRTDSSFGKLGFGSGWDIISPAGFGMPIWLALIFRGARAGGLKELELFQLECNNLSNYVQPDSTAGETEQQAMYSKLKKHYFRLPPDKRPNFIKLGILSPFFPCWKVLVKDWISKTAPKTDKLTVDKQDFSVLRDKNILMEIKEIVAKFEKCRSVNLKKFLNFGLNYLVPVSIECVGKGTPSDLALICLPKRNDLSGTAKKKLEPTEPSHLDENEQTRKMLKSEHAKLLKSLKRKRRKERLKLKEDFANNLPGKLTWKDILKSDSAPSKSASEEYKNKIEALWIPQLEKIDSIINSSSRQILGFVVKGGFSFSKSVGVSIGYITLPGLVELANVCREAKSKILVLVRNRNNFQYRFGKLNVIV